MTTNQRATRRARHGASHRDSAAWRWTAAATAAILGFAIVFSVTYINKLQNVVTTQDITSLLGTPDASADPTVSPSDGGPLDAAAGNDLNILLVGSDSRDGANGDIGGKVADGMRSDTTIIMHISADRSRVDFLSIPRDTLADVPGQGPQKINSAYATGGAKLEVLLADTQSKPDVARTEAERLINAGAQILQGPFSSGDAAAIVPVVQQRRVPFLVDIAAADPITANVAKAVKEGQQKVQYVYRNFPTGSSFGRKAVQYFTEIFAEAKVTPRRVAPMYCNDLFGQNQWRGFLAAYKAARPAWTLLEEDVIAWPEPPSDLSTEVSKVKSLKPDVIAPRDLRSTSDRHGVSAYLSAWLPLFIRARRP